MNFCSLPILFSVITLSPLYDNFKAQWVLQYRYVSSVCIELLGFDRNHFNTFTMNYWIEIESCFLPSNGLTFVSLTWVAVFFNRFVFNVYMQAMAEEKFKLCVNAYKSLCQALSWLHILKPLALIHFCNQNPIPIFIQAQLFWRLEKSCTIIIKSSCFPLMCKLLISIHSTMEDVDSISEQMKLIQGAIHIIYIVNYCY